MLSSLYNTDLPDMIVIWTGLHLNIYFIWGPVQNIPLATYIHPATLNENFNYADK